MLAALRVDAVSFGGLRITVADVAALGALAAVLLALARGKADASALQGGSGTGVYLLLLPGLVLFVLAVAAARLLAPALRLLELAARRATPRVRVALLSLARAPGEVSLTVVFFVLSVGIAVFAIAYRATLVQGEHEQARYAVPAPYVLSEDLGELVTIQQAPLPARYHPTPVLRDSGFVSGNHGRDFTLARAARARARRRSTAGAPTSRRNRRRSSAACCSQRARRRCTASACRQRTPHVHASVHDHRRPRRADGHRREPARRLHAALVRRARRRRARGDRARCRRGARRPRRRAPALVPGDRRRMSPGTAPPRQALGVNDASTGTLSLPPAFARWFGTHGITPDGRAFHFIVNNAADSILRPHQPLENELVPVVTTPAIAVAAGPSGIVPLHVENTIITGKIVATTRYFPSVDGDAVIADLPTWLTVANTAEPGVATRVGALARHAAAGRPAARPRVAARARLHELTSDPLARGAISLLLVTALVGLVLAAVGLLLTVVGDLRDERGSLQDLAAQGATPADLRRHVLATRGDRRRASVSRAGSPPGAIVGALVVAVVTVTAGAENALPPLRSRSTGRLVAARARGARRRSAAAATATARRLR